MLRRDKAMKILIEKKINTVAKLMFPIDRPIVSCIFEGAYVLLQPKAEKRTIEDWKILFKNKIVAIYWVNPIDNDPLSLMIRYCIMGTV